MLCIQCLLHTGQPACSEYHTAVVTHAGVQHNYQQPLSANATVLTCSLKERQWQGKQHSPAQEQARQRAADELVKQQYSWLGPLAGMFSRNMQQGSSSVANDEHLGRDQVGRRRRAPAAAAAGNAASQATIPVERSLVVINKKDA